MLRGYLMISRIFSLQICLDLLDHLGVFRVGQLDQAGVHGKHAAPLVFVLVLGHKVEVEMAAGIAVCAVVDLVGMEGRVDGLGTAVNIGELGVALLIGEVDKLADVILVGHDAAAGMALLPEEDQRGNFQVADHDAECIQQFAAHAVAAVGVFHNDASCVVFSHYSLFCPGAQARFLYAKRLTFVWNECIMKGTNE